MNARCRAHTIVSVAALLSWAVVAVIMVAPPVPDSPLRLPFFAVLGAAIVSTNLALWPLVMRGFLKDTVLAYVAGYHHREEDEEQPRHLRAV